MTTLGINLLEITEGPNLTATVVGRNILSAVEKLYDIFTMPVSFCMLQYLCRIPWGTEFRPHFVTFPNIVALDLVIPLVYPEGTKRGMYVSQTIIMSFLITSMGCVSESDIAEKNRLGF